MNKLIGYVTKIVSHLLDVLEYLAYLAGKLACLAGFHDWGAVYPRFGAFARYDVCNRPGCRVTRGWVRKI